MLSGTAIAGAPPSIPSKPTGGGGGGGGGGSYSPPEFKPYTVNLQTTDGGVNGVISVKSYSLASLLAEKKLSDSNDSVTVRLAMDLDSAPSSSRLDIRPLDVTGVTTPLDIDLFSSVLAFNLTRYSSGGEWPMKRGTVHMSLLVPLDLLNSTDINSSFYLVKDDGTSTILYDAVPVIDNGTARFDIPLWYEAGSPTTSGIYTLAGTRARAASTPTPTPVPATPTPKSGNDASILLLIAALGIG